MLTLDGVTLDNVILLGGIDDLDGATSTVTADSTVEDATLQDGTMVVTSGQMLTLDTVTLEAALRSLPTAFSPLPPATQSKMPGSWRRPVGARNCWSTLRRSSSWPSER